MTNQRAFGLVLLFAAAPLSSQVTGEFFEQKIRPVLAAKCYTCHSSKLKAPMASLTLDTKAGLQKGGISGPIVVAGKPAESRLLLALSYADSHLHMPPTGKLPDTVIADFEKWIAGGAPDPREDAAASPSPLKGMDVVTGRKWWAFQPATELPVPPVKDTSWPRTKIDSFILA